MYASRLFLLRTRSHHRQVHYHIIPAPKFSSALATGLGPRESDTNQKLPLTAQDMHRKEYESRNELDEDDAHVLIGRIKAHL
jgi:hypothetical protein